MGIFQVQCCTLCNVTASCDCKIFSESCLGSINVTGFLVVIDNRLFLCQSWGSHTQQPSCVDKWILADICIPESPPLGLFPCVSFQSSPFTIQSSPFTHVLDTCPLQVAVYQVLKHWSLQQIILCVYTQLNYHLSLFSILPN